MGIDLVFKIAAVGIVVAILYQVLKSTGREDQALMISVGGLIVVLLIIAKEVANLFDTVKTLFNLG
jgi:stage III sporulation protein AC